VSYAPQDSLEDLDTFVRHRTGPLILLVLTSVAAAAATVLALGLLQKPVVHKVPALVGLSLQKAKLATGKQQLQLVIAAEVFDPLVPKGAIAVQEPLAGRTIDKKRVVSVWISRGKAKALAAPAKAPQTVNPPKTAALSTKQAVKPTPVGSSSARAGFSESTGAASAELVVVPPVRGVPLAAAKARLNKAGLKVGRIREKSDEDVSEGRILGQRPKAGKRVPKGTPVKLIVNRFDE
jgi:beta-lactam-binding protein with PASTA domain